jgi:ribose transport system permease protein
LEISNTLEKKKGPLSVKLSEWDQFLIPVTLVVLVVVLTFLNEYFLTVHNLLNVLQQISILAIVAAGMTFVIIGGGFDLSVGSVVALSGSLASIIMIEQGVIAGVTAGLIIGVIIGWINGLLISKLNISPFIATLGMLVIARGLALGLTGGSAVFNLPPSFSWLGSGKVFGIPVPVIIVVIIYIIGIIVLKKTAFGLRVYAVGGNKEAARLSGIAVSKYITATYIICSSCAALAGVILAARLRAGEPTAGITMELFAIAAVVLGGASLKGGEGFLGRTVIGVLFIGLLQNGLNLMNVPYYWQQVVIGCVFIVAACVGVLRSRKE